MTGFLRAQVKSNCFTLRYWPSDDSAPKRTHSSVMKNAEQAARSGLCVSCIHTFKNMQ